MTNKNKITIELDHEDMVNMLCGISVGYDYYSVLSRMKLGDYRGGFCDRWDWNRDAIKRLHIKKIYDIYTKIKNKQEILLPIEEAQDNPYSECIEKFLEQERELFKRLAEKQYEMFLEQKKQ
jgi:hypothetical protein